MGSLLQRWVDGGTKTTGDLLVEKKNQLLFWYTFETFIISKKITNEIK